MLSDSAEKKACVRAACAAGGLNRGAVTADHAATRYCASGLEARSCRTFLSHLRGVRSASAGVRFHKPASCLVCVVREEPVTDRRGSILQLVFTVGMTWRTERWCTAAHKAPARVRAARRASLAGRSRGLFCLAAIMSVCHRLAQRLARIDGGAGLNLIADAHAHRS